MSDLGERLLKASEVARMFHVDPRTVGRWALAGRISSVKTPGGHRRFTRGDKGILGTGAAMVAVGGTLGLFAVQSWWIW